MVSVLTKRRDLVISFRRSNGVSSERNGDVRGPLHQGAAMNTCGACGAKWQTAHFCPKEPQDVAPSMGGAQCPLATCGDAASCDFSDLPRYKCSHCGGSWDAAAPGGEELAAIRARLVNVEHRTDRTWAEVDALSLLRMVDELRAVVQGNEQRLKAAWQREDALRAQLSSTDPEHDATDAAHPCWWRGHDNGAKGMAELVERLRAKLAEAERTIQHKVEELRHESAQFWAERRRADAAEARVKELERRLKSTE